MYDELKIGSIVRVEGETSAGGFVPDITAHSIEFIGKKSLPKRGNSIHLKFRFPQFISIARGSLCMGVWLAHILSTRIITLCSKLL